MLAAVHRLHRRSDFAAALRRGRRVGRGTLVVHLANPPADSDSPPKVGFVVSRAVGGAVTRNRVRRRLRHLAREHLAELPAGSLVVVRALPAAADASYRRLAGDLAAALAAAAARRRGGAR